jgi:hypothetical protein
MSLAPIIWATSERRELAPSGLMRVGGVTQGKPWAESYSPFRATNRLKQSLSSRHRQGLNEEGDCREIRLYQLAGKQPRTTTTRTRTIKKSGIRQ